MGGNAGHLKMMDHAEAGSRSANPQPKHFPMNIRSNTCIWQQSSVILLLERWLGIHHPYTRNTGGHHMG